VNIVARTATPADVERMMPQLDDQFVYGKGRDISLVQRFPAVYCPENARNLFLLVENSEILSSVACKCFTLRCESGSWNGAMIGAVYTRPQRRGEQLASRILEHAAWSLRERQLDFAVLWTDQPAFYARLGWSSVDCGLLGEFENSGECAQSRGGIISMAAHECDIALIERVRERWCERMTPRQADDYRQLPLPAQAVLMLASGAGSNHMAYALLGTKADTGILYEMVGHPDGFSALWPEICRGYRKILINDATGSPSHCWLLQHTRVIWTEKPLAMWLTLSGKSHLSQLKHWYIPYFDRI